MNVLKLVPLKVWGYGYRLVYGRLIVIWVIFMSMILLFLLSFSTHSYCLHVQVRARLRVSNRESERMKIDVRVVRSGAYDLWDS
uniref:Uncharacterized protein n=1 Tax=Cannabis sativa TaxID=3483 RepID=A0A803R4V8_CANSA